MRNTLCVTFFYVAAYAFITGSPFVYIDYFHVDPQYYGFWFGVNILGVMAMSAVNRRLAGRMPLERLLWLATLVASAAALVQLVMAFTGIGGIWGLAVPIFVVFSTNGIIAACANAAALASVDSRNAGSATALLGSLQYGSGIVSSLLLAAFSSGTPRTMAWVITLFVLLSAVMAAGGRRASDAKHSSQTQPAARPCGRASCPRGGRTHGHATPASISAGTTRDRATAHPPDGN